MRNFSGPHRVENMTATEDPELSLAELRQLDGLESDLSNRGFDPSLLDALALALGLDNPETDIPAGDVPHTDAPSTDVPGPAPDDPIRSGVLGRPGGLLARLRVTDSDRKLAHLRVYSAGEPMELSDVLEVIHSFAVRVTEERVRCAGASTNEPAKTNEPARTGAPAKTNEPARTGAPARANEPAATSQPAATSETAWAASPAPVLMYDFGLRLPCGADPAAEFGRRMEAAFVATWRGDTEIDGLNALVVTTPATWQQVMILRAYTRYLAQAQGRFSRARLEAALRDNPAIAARLIDLFEVRFSPDADLPLESRRQRATHAAARTRQLLDDVENLEHDQVLRMYLDTIQATLRTTAFQPSSAPHGPEPQDHQPHDPEPPCLAMKFDSAAIDCLPRPRPVYEIFGYSPRFEAVHLRFGPVARGGMRWSDRPDDLRTEILGLAKTQIIKNAVIVPTGAKGGFVLKRGREPHEAVRCYRQFVTALLDLTDNIVDGREVAAECGVRHDGADPYLVVAADKGTATFSDLANAIACERDFWLGDAFASGGSTGYDHKAIGITARGAWVSALQSFHELGIDPSTQPITVVGIGDMSGDVFGNGMLHSQRLRLIAAFDHRSIFLDPDPDPALAYAERRRLFTLPRSSWADYRPESISEGGGVWPRSAKAIRLSPQARAALGLPEGCAELSPVDLVRAILTAPVDLLFNGGVGTYVKAAGERHADAGDKTNDAVRVDGRQLRARVVCEGGNLGFTQLGRVEYARGGGRIMTDFIDNAGGVNCSDHEVNIKILLEKATAGSALGQGQREALLASMTETVAQRVLADQRSQALALGLERQDATSLLGVHRRMLAEYERTGRLDRAGDGLPDEAAMDRRAAQQAGLTSPEIAVLLAHTKILISEEILASEVPDEAWTAGILTGYFPDVLIQRYPQAASAHPLRREIVATRLAGEMVDRGGVGAVFGALEETGSGVADLARAWMALWKGFGLDELWRRLADPIDQQSTGQQPTDQRPVASRLTGQRPTDPRESRAGRLPIAARHTALLHIRRFVDQGLRWLVTRRPQPLDVPAEAARLASVAARLPRIEGWLTRRERQALRARTDSLTGLGLPAELAVAVGRLCLGFRLLDVHELASERDLRIDQVAPTSAAVAERLDCDLLLHLVSELPWDDRWRSLARAALHSDIHLAIAGITGQVIDPTEAHLPPQRLVDRWIADRGTAASRYLSDVASLPEDRPDLAALSVTVRSLAAL